MLFSKEFVPKGLKDSAWGLNPRCRLKNAPPSQGAFVLVLVLESGRGRSDGALERWSCVLLGQRIAPDDSSCS